ncbi:MAG: glycosyltransferase family 4 protein [Novosphingobium sp.]
MKIAFISEHYPPTDGGVATSTQRIARNLRRLGIDVHVLCFDHSQALTSRDYVCEEDDHGVRVSRVGPFFLKQKSQSAESVPEKLKATFRRRACNQMIRLLRDSGEVDLILSFYMINAGYIATFVARSLGVPHVCGVRGNDIGRNIFHVERFGVTRWIAEGATHIVCVNNFLRGRLLMAFPEVAAKTSVIANTVTLPTPGSFDRTSGRQRILAAAGWSNDVVIATFIGTLREKKGVETLASAMDSLAADTRLRLLLIGPPPGKLERHICGEVWDRLVERGLVWNTGRVPLGEVAGWACGAEIVTMPSIDDGMANGLLEGMALGLCPVATEIFSDVITDGRNGIAVPSSNHLALAEALEALADDPARLAMLGDAARSAMGCRQPSEEADEYVTLFADLMQQGAGERREFVEA